MDFNLKEEYEFWSQIAWIQIWPLPLTSYIILVEVTDLLCALVSLNVKEDSISTDLIRWLWGIHELGFVKPLEQLLAHGKSCVSLFNPHHNLMR